MTGRQVAIVEWALAVILLIWFAVFLILNGNLLTLGVTITSLFFAPGLALSLGFNGLVHFRSRRRLAISEYVLLGIEALIVVALVVASVVDQSMYVSGGIVPSLGYWLEWFVLPWVLLGPVALTVLILGLVKRKPAAPYAGTSASAR